MVSQPENPTYDPGVYEWEVTDPVQGGVGGVANAPLLNLANRTAYLKQRLDSLVSGALIPPTVAPLNGPAFTGSTTAPNVAPGDDSTLIANTNFVQTAKAGIAVVPVGGNQNVVLTQPQWGVGILIFTGALTGNVSAIFPNKSGVWVVSNRTTGAFTLTTKTAAGTGVVIPQAAPQAGIFGDGTNIYLQNSPFSLGNNGTTSGTFPYPTVSVSATGLITAISANLPVTTFNTRNGAVSLTSSDVTNALTFTPVRQGTGQFQDPAAPIHIGYDGAWPRIQVTSTDFGRLAVMDNGAPTTNPGDIRIGGSGRFGGSLSSGGGLIASSGDITADFGRLRAHFGARGSGDGLAAVILQDFAAGFAGDGYVNLPNGIIIQWGSINVPIDDTARAFNLPFAFPNATYSVVGGLGALASVLNVTVGFQPFGATQYVCRLASPSVTGALGCWFMAAGS